MKKSPMKKLKSLFLFTISSLIIVGNLFMAKSAVAADNEINFSSIPPQLGALNNNPVVQYENSDIATVPGEGIETVILNPAGAEVTGRRSWQELRRN